MANVVLQPVDGGPNYYSVNGFTQALSAGWDNGVIPIGPWLAPMLTQSDAARWTDLGLNTAYAFTGNSTMSLFTANHISAIVNSQELSQILANNGGALGASTVGLLTYDEPPTYAAGVSTALSTTANSIQDHHFWWINMTWNEFVFGGLNGTPGDGTTTTDFDSLITTPTGTQRHIDLTSADIYWFSGARTTSGLRSEGGLIYNLGRDMTADEAARGSNYGDMIDAERAFQAGHFPAPITAFVEDGGPWSENTTASTYITPPELNWAVWSSLIHGARNIVYFNHTFAGPAPSQDNLRDPYYSTVQPGQTISIYNQVKATDALVQQMGPILDAPFALHYVSTPGGYNYGNVVDHTLNGIETAAHFYNNSFYIFADTRDSEALHNIAATFTLNDPTATSVTVLNENRSINVVNGQFSDTFANASTVHIYQVNEGGTPPPPGPPPRPTISSFSPDTAPVGDGHTTATAITLSGTAEANSTVSLFDGTTAAGSAHADASGNWNILDSGLTVTTHVFTATDTDANGTSTPSNPFDVTVDAIVPPPPGSFSTTFPTLENRVSVGGHLITSTSPGVNWSGLKLGGSGTKPVSPVDVVAPATAESVNYANSNFGDALAVATGTWAPDQSASVVVGNIAAQAGGTEEFEVHLRTSPTTGAGYEVFWAYNNDYIGVATWHAAGGYTNLYFNQGTQFAVHPGDTLTASIKGNVITVFDNGVQEAQITDNTFTTGNPGFGFNEGGTHEYAISGFSAIGLSGTPQPPPAPTIDNFSPDTAPVGDHHTTATVLTLTGTGEPNSTVTLFDGTAKVGSVVLGSDGHWSDTTGTLTVSTHVFTATDTDANGTSAASSPFSVILDPTVPPPSNIVNNGDFETGSFSGWTVGGRNASATIITNAEHGSLAAALGGQGGTITQTLPTTVGQKYELTFWLADEQAGKRESFSASIGTAKYSETSPTQAHGYVEHTLDFTATATSTVLQFQFQNVPAHWHLDNVAVVGIAT